MLQTADGWGLIDQNGGLHIAPQFDDIDLLEDGDGLYLVHKDGVTAFTVDEESYLLAFQAGSVSLWFSVDQYRKERRYDWIECQDRAALDEDSLIELADYISDEWDDGEAIYCSANAALAREQLARERTVPRNQVEADALLAFLDWQG